MTHGGFYLLSDPGAGVYTLPHVILRSLLFYDSRVCVSPLLVLADLQNLALLIAPCF